MVRNTHDGTLRVQVYSQAGQILYGTQQSGSNVQSIAYIYLAGKAIAQKSSASSDPAYLYTDALGSPVATSGTVPASIGYTCSAGWSLSGNLCSQGTTSTIAATVSGYTCPSGYTLAGSSCSQTTVTTSAATPNYSCPMGWTLSGGNCVQTITTAATPIYGCPSGLTLSGTTCSGTNVTAASQSWDCKGQGSLQTLSWSPSGNYCTTRTVNKTVAVDGCSDLTPAGLTYLGWRQNGTNTAACYFGPAAVYSCPAGASLSGTSCYAPISQAATVSSYTCPSGAALTGTNCTTTNTSAVNVSYGCPAGQTLSGATCSSSSTTTVAATPVYTCPSGYLLSGSNCSKSGTTTQAATASYVCASGIVSGSSCLGALTRTRYEAYGNTASGTVPTGLGFTGHVNDADTGIVYMQQRYYDPIAARFMSMDPIATDANTGKSFNVYEYAQSNPYRYTDPDGADPKCSAGMGGCAVTQFYGKPQKTGTPGHDTASQKVGEAAAKQGAAKVYYHTSLSKVTDDASMGQQKADVAVVWKDSKVSTVEIPSNSQTFSSQEAKGEGMQAKLATIGRAGNANTISVSDALGGNFAVKSAGALSIGSIVVRAIEIGRIESEHGRSVPFVLGQMYLAGQVSREQVVNAVAGD